MYPGCTAIERMMFQYSLGKKNKRVSSTAKVIQFPLMLLFRGTCGYPPSKEDKNCSHLHLHVCTDCTAAAVLSMLLHSKLYRGSENNSNLRQLCFDLPRIKACSSYSLEAVRRRPLEVATVTRTLKLTLKYLSEEVEIEK